MNKNGRLIIIVISSIVAFSLLLGAITGTVYFLYIIPKQTQEKIEWEKEQKRKEEESAAKEQERKVIERQEREEQREKCLTNALLNYANNWANACKSNAIVTEKYNENLEKIKQDCINRAESFNLDSSYCSTTDYSKTVNSSPDCELPAARADSLNEDHEKSRAECYLKYPVE